MRRVCQAMYNAVQGRISRGRVLAVVTGLGVGLHCNMQDTCDAFVLMFCCLNSAKGHSPLHLSHKPKFRLMCLALAVQSFCLLIIPEICAWNFPSLPFWDLRACKQCIVCHHVDFIQYSLCTIGLRMQHPKWCMTSCENYMYRTNARAPCYCVLPHQPSRLL